MLEEQPTWSYSSLAAERMRQASAVIDLDTGGGERLLQLRADWPPKVVATENYTPNFRLADQRLAPLGVRVFNVRSADNELLPFANGEFDLVLNRHASFNPSEAARILAPGGVFLTEQVHGLWAQDLLVAFGAKPQWPRATSEWYAPRLRAAGLTIVLAEEWAGQFMFKDVGAIVYYLKAVPWLVPGFSVETHSGCLLTLQRRLERGDSLAFSAREYLIEASKL
jgi:SAM-dependent methyltransferase